MQSLCFFCFKVRKILLFVFVLFWVFRGFALDVFGIESGFGS